MTPSSPRTHRLVHGLKMAVYRAGFDVRRETFKRHFVRSLSQRGITCVIDVGANTGQFATDLRRAGFGGRIVSVEPLGGAFAQLSKAAAHDPDWTVLHAAVGASAGTLTMNVAGNSASSSVLPMLSRHTDAAPQSRYVATEVVTAVTVDGIVAEYGLTPGSTMLKIDVQGYEGAVLEGATTTLRELCGVRTEMSFAALYEGQPLFADILARLEAQHFELWLLDPGFVEPASGRLLQADGTFYRGSGDGAASADERSSGPL